jgi:hypothetical protein
MIQEPTYHYPANIIHTLQIGISFHALPKHGRRIVVNIINLAAAHSIVPFGPLNIIIDTNGSVLFGPFGYHNWIISTSDEEILIYGGG